MFWRNTWPAIVWALVILILCGIPGDRLPELTFLEWLSPDKIVHLILFGTQSFLLMRGFEKQTDSRFLARHAVLISILVAIIYGCLIEVMQTYIFIHRSGDVRDAIANSIGAFIGWWIYRKNFKLKNSLR